MSDEKVLEKLDEIKAILKIIALDQLQKTRSRVISTRNKEQIFELCTGKNEMSQIAKKADVSREAVRLAIRDFEDVGLIITKKNGNKAFPKKVL